LDPGFYVEISGKGSEARRRAIFNDALFSRERKGGSARRQKAESRKKQKGGKRRQETGTADSP
jgi:hypothetical protein